MDEQVVNSSVYVSMIKSAVINIQKHAKEINDLNVFPIPDGDTGDNMLLTISGGLNSELIGNESLGETAKQIAVGMLLSARGNSGVITSQFFDGVASGLKGKDSASVKEFGEAFIIGVQHAYKSVIEPVEGTILTVAREATYYAVSTNTDSLNTFLEAFIFQAKETLKNTPELLDVLKKAGVVDSGGAGLIYIVEGMKNSLQGNQSEEDSFEITAPVKQQKIDINSFTSDSVLEFGYCTELLLRLMNNKTNPKVFDINIIVNYLQSIGNSVVAFKNDTIIKLHVHTMDPEKVLNFCHKYCEFLTVKIENMSLQHNSLEPNVPKLEKKKYAIVEVACGKGIEDTFLTLGADQVIKGGNGMNPSANDFINTFNKINTETIFVFPNNPNIILAAKQAANMYDKANVVVIESKSLGEGHIALTMFNPDINDIEQIKQDFYSSMEGVNTVEVSICSRNTTIDGLTLNEGDYIGFSEKKILASGKNKIEAAFNLIDALDFTDKSGCIIFYGQQANEKDAEEIKHYITSKHSDIETFIIDGQQNLHDFILIIE